MKNISKKAVLVLILCLTAVSVFADAVLSADVLDTVLSSVFEVLVEKAPDEGIEYDRDPPLSLIAYSIRSDSYTPIGTCFLMQDGCFYSAAHVFNMYEDSFYKKHYIRDRNGNVYPVQDILMYDSERDYIAFSVEGFTTPEGAGLAVAEEQMNIPVFSVGNALGDGIVIRSGLLTSRTKEDNAGLWEWLRFSAAASPGNSGGPLITPEGKVLGIICMKSQNENLNYALPTAEVLLAPRDTGFVRVRFSYEMPEVSYDKWSYRFEKEFPLPQKFDELQAMLISEYAEFMTTVAKDLKATFEPGGEKAFDQVPGIANNVAANASYAFPLELVSAKKDVWEFNAPSNIYKTNLEDEGFIKTGQMLTINFSMLEKPESMTLRDLYASPKTYMDMFLKAVQFNRTIETETIHVVSFGDPISSEVYVDAFGRDWFVDIYNLSFADRILISFTLPSPSGAFNFMRLFDKASLARGVLADMQLTADLFYVHYCATFDEWQEFFELIDEGVFSMPETLKGFATQKDETGYYVETSEFRLDVPVSVQVPDETTDIIVYPRYEFEDERIVQRPRFVEVMPDRGIPGYSYISIHSYPAPLAGSSKATQQAWARASGEVAPYNGVPYNNDNYTYLDRIRRKEGTDDRIIILGYELLGQNRNQEILEFAQQIENGLTVESSILEK